MVAFEHDVEHDMEHDVEHDMEHDMELSQISFTLFALRCIFSLDLQHTAAFIFQVRVALSLVDGSHIVQRQYTCMTIRLPQARKRLVSHTNPTLHENFWQLIVALL